MMPHTPAPWVYGTREDGSIWLSMGTPLKTDHRQGDLDFGEENARLISAAPDLLKALNTFLKCVSVSDHMAAIIEARAAIAKATGE